MNNIPLVGIVLHLELRLFCSVGKMADFLEDSLC